MIEDTSCGLLFDVSNAVVAEINTGAPVSEWSTMLEDVRHFHAAGYRMSETSPSLAIDSHDSPLNEHTCGLIAKAIGAWSPGTTLVVERDAHIEVAAWRTDIHAARSSSYGHRGIPVA